MKRIMILIGIVGMMISAVLVFSSAFASQIMGTPLYTDPGAHERIMSSPRPEGFRFSWPSLPSVDLEVEWEVIGDTDFYRGITGIFIDRDGTLRVVDIHTRAMRGMRLWKSDDLGKSWQIERETMDADRDRGASLVGKEKGEVLFSPFHSGTRPFRIWPLEVETLIKTEFRGLYEHLAHTDSGARVFLAQDSNDPKVMAFITTIAHGDRIIRIFVTIDGGETWLEISPLYQSAFVGPGADIDIGGLAVKKKRDAIRIFVGLRGIGPRMVQAATIDLSELEKVLIAKE